MRCAVTPKRSYCGDMIDTILKFLTFIPNALAGFREPEKLKKDYAELEEKANRLEKENNDMKAALDIGKGLVRGKYGAMWNQENLNDPNQPYCTRCVSSRTCRSILIPDGEAWHCPVCNEGYNYHLPDDIFPKPPFTPFFQ